MKNILVPTDFSELADKAIRSAIKIAKNTNTTLHLVHSVEILHVWSELANYKSIETEKHEGYSYIHAVTDKAIEKLQERKSEIEKEGITCIVAVENGKPYESVLNYIEYNNISLVIMGTKGASGVNEVIFGSNAQKIIRNSKCPVLIIKEDQEALNFETIVFASDFHEDKINANIEYVAKLAKYFGAKVTCLFISTPLNFLSENEIQKNVKSLIDKTTLQNYTIEIHKSESAEEGIMEYCMLNPPGLVAITTHGKGFFRKLFISNTTEYLANHLDAPLLSMPVQN